MAVAEPMKAARRSQTRDMVHGFLVTNDCAARVEHARSFRLLTCPDTSFNSPLPYKFGSDGSEILVQTKSAIFFPCWRQ